MKLKVNAIEIDDIEIKRSLSGSEFFEISIEEFNLLNESQKQLLRNIKFGSYVTLINDFGMTREARITSRNFSDTLVQFYFL